MCTYTSETEHPAETFSGKLDSDLVGDLAQIGRSRTG